MPPILRATLLCAFLPLGPVLGQDTNTDVLQGQGVETLIYGIYCAEAPIDLEEAPGTAAGVVNLVSDLPEMRAIATRVPARLGIGFGLLVELKDGLIHDPLSITLTHPPYPDSGIEVETWQSAVDEISPGLIGFSFEQPSELVVGAWTFEAVHDGEVVFRVTFDVVPPALAPDLAGSCEGAFLS